MSLNSLFRVLSVFACLFMLVLCSFANIVKSKDWLVQTREHKLLTLYADTFSYPDTEMRKGELACYVELSGVNLRVLIVGPVAGDAKSYARLLEKWGKAQGFNSDVEYSQEDDCAAASLAFQAGKFGIYEASTKFEFKSLLDELKGLEPKARLGFVHPLWTTTDFKPAPGKVTSKSKLWDLTAAPAGFEKVTSTMKVQFWMPVVLVLWLTVPVAGFLIGSGLGYYVFKRKDWPLAKRRKLYGKVLLGSTYVSLGLHTILVLATLPTRALDPLSQLWFGTRFSAIGQAIVPLFIIVPVASLPLLNKLELKLFGPSEEEATTIQSAEKEVEPIVREAEAGQNSQLKRRIPILIIFLAIFVVMQILVWNLPKESELKSPLRIFSQLVLFAPVIFALKTKFPQFRIDDATYNEVQARVQNSSDRLADMIGIKRPKVKVLKEQMYGKYHAHATANEIGVSLYAAENLTDTQLNFILAHELAHLKYKHSLKRMILLITPMLFIFAPVLARIWFPDALRSIGPYMTYILMASFAVVIVTQAILVILSRKNEFVADELAVRTTRDPETAIQTLLRITSQSEMPGLHQVYTSTHPMTKKRIERIKSLKLA